LALRIVKPSAVALGSLSAGLGTQRANFRLISATHKPLQQMVADGRFRQDLYYRISAFPIYLSPLRERTADIPMLVDSFLQRGSSAKHRIAVEPAAMARLQSHDWPGNIRELRNVLERASLFADDGVVRAEHLPDFVSAGGDRSATQGWLALPRGQTARTLSNSKGCFGTVDTRGSRWLRGWASANARLTAGSRRSGWPDRQTASS
jgi:DNA-binding NtrC family response regulator